ncbi:hypothetical protein QLL94_gp44 [Pectobacterium phage PP2]|uniref:Ig-like domain-containing protein n=1 Tax=Pectobacterium phage PP2 TaxID=1897743 RepID=A0A1W5P528_9CAUD|nr:hypothetical protein QLL94_gp44 [Pectobacterium phage PP2]AOT25410.1 hypothetical protein PP2_044 [Pectobacterium phage PP2]
MITSQAPFLSALQGAKLRTLAVNLQNYADNNPGAKPAVYQFWQSQKTLASADSGIPSDGTYIPGVKDLRPTCYKVLSHYRTFPTSDITEYTDFCDFFSAANAPVVEELVFSLNLPETKEVAQGATLTLQGAVTGGVSPYTYAWLKDDVVIEGRVSASFTKSNFDVSDEGKYVLQVTDAESTVILSQACGVSLAV